MVSSGFFFPSETFIARDTNLLLVVKAMIVRAVLNLSVPDLFLFWICSVKYSTALHNIFNIFEKVQKIQYLGQP